MFRPILVLISICMVLASTISLALVMDGQMRGTPWMGFMYGAGLFTLIWLALDV